MELFYFNKLLSISTQLCKWHNVILLKYNRFKYRNDTYFICMYTILWLSLIHCTIYELHVKFVQLIENMFGWDFKLLILLGCDVDVVVINTITMLRYSWIYSLSYQTKWHLIWEQYISCPQRGCKRKSEMRTCYCHSWYFNIETM